MSAPVRRVSSTLAALHLQLTYGVSITPAAVRKWGERGWVRRHDGPHAYDLDEVDTVARSRGLAGS